MQLAAVVAAAPVGVPGGQGPNLPGAGALQHRDLGEPPPAVTVPPDVQQHLHRLSGVASMCV